VEPTKSANGGPAVVTAYRVYAMFNQEYVETVTFSRNLTSVVIRGLDEGSWSFMVAAVDDRGQEGLLSVEAGLP
jgi:hypothetical protein